MPLFHLIPLYDVARRFLICLNSCIKQRHSGFIMVVDDKMEGDDDTGVFKKKSNTTLFEKLNAFRTTINIKLLSIVFVSFKDICDF